jgi:hypothetical protein
VIRRYPAEDVKLRSVLVVSEFDALTPDGPTVGH